MFGMIFNFSKKINSKLGALAFKESLNRQQDLSYSKVQEHWDNPDVAVHGGMSEADLRHYFDSIDMQMRFCKDDSVLDIGCGDGKVDNFILKTGASVCGFDFAKSKVEQAKALNPQAEYWQQSFLEPFNKKPCNKIFSYGVFQYCAPEDAEKFLENSMRAINMTGGGV